ncbi:MAG: hypothetical protein JXA42_03140, partial [Anaerolineales bacterium]|nr:hypothetical protein [Anaerolineales bacterium]
MTAFNIKTFSDENYWREQFKITKDDIEMIFSLLMQVNSPRNIDILIYHLILFRCGLTPKDHPFLDMIANLPIEVDIYQPLNDYFLGQEIFFANLDCEKFFGPYLKCSWWKKDEPLCNRIGIVIKKLPKEKVAGSLYMQKAIFVRFTQCTREKGFTCDLDTHDPFIHTIKITKKLNAVQGLAISIIQKYGRFIKEKLVHFLKNDKRFTYFDNEWFLVNLVSSEFESMIIQASDQWERVPTPFDALDVLDTELVEKTKNSKSVFDVNKAIEKTGKYREVTGRDKVYWVSKKTIWPPPPGKPKQLSIPPVRSEIKVGTRELNTDLQQIWDSEKDEFYETAEVYNKVSLVEVAISASHRYHGTLPLTSRTRGIFSPGDKDACVTFIDARGGDLISGGFSPKDKYAWGLTEWYETY